MSGVSPQEREFVERIGLFMEQLGGTRMMGRIYGWLTICPAEHQSITELAEVLQVSKASISTVIRQLEQGQIVERAPVSGTRQHHYRLRPGGWAQVMRARAVLGRVGVDAAEYGLAVIDDDRGGRRERLEELRDYFTFVTSEFGDEMVRRWEAYRKRRRDAHVDGPAQAAARRTDSDPPR
ncbi:MarR family transcriptional regulator [Micromonospora sp. CPCC 205371]|nr:MarR family transcriptional regulator [Micromonospora sp. CPCC 205371]